MPHLFDSLNVRDVTLRNRIGVSPMCEYSSENGMPNDWHLVHLGSRAVGGAGLVITEAAAVNPAGRISPADAGMWSDAHAEAWARITAFIEEHGAVPGIQIAHAGRKASTSAPWDGGGAVPDESGGWEPVAPSPGAFDDSYRVPVELTVDQIREIQWDFAEAARRAVGAGFKFLELHGAHGYLANEFLSPLTNHRSDEYGGSFANRTRFVVETVRAIRKEWPERLPLAVRLSCADWVEGGWSISDSTELAGILKNEAVDIIDCSSGGSVPHAKIPVGAGYQVPFAEEIKRATGMLTAAVGMITEPMQADDIVRNGRADIVLMARQLLRDPYWPLHAAAALHQVNRAPVPNQYARAFPQA